MMRNLLLLLLALVGAGCNQAPDDPEQTYRLFLDRVQKGDVDGAWALLAPDTQEALTALAAQRARASGGVIPADPKEAMLGSARLARPVEKIAVARAGDATTTLLVEAGGRTDEVVLVRSDGGWRVRIDVPAAPSAAPDETNAPER